MPKKKIVSIPAPADLAAANWPNALREIDHVAESLVLSWLRNASPRQRLAAVAAVGVVVGWHNDPERPADPEFEEMRQWQSIRALAKEFEAAGLGEQISARTLQYWAEHSATNGLDKLNAICRKTRRIMYHRARLLTWLGMPQPGPEDESW